MNGSIKVPVTVDATQFEKGVKDAVKDAKKELQTLNGEEILTPESIKKQVKEREKALRKYIKDRKSQGYFYDQSEEETYRLYNRKIRGQSGEYYDQFRMKLGDTFKTLEPPAELEEKLIAKMQKQQEELRIKEEIAETEKKITKENELQAKAEQNKLDDVEEQNTKKKGGFLNTLSSIGSKIGGVLAGAGQYIALIGKIAVAGVLIKGIMAVLERVFYAIISKVNELMNKIREKNSEIFTKIMVIKSMIDSILETIKPFMTQLLHGFLNAIIEAFRFIQHVVYAITGVDIFKYTAQKLADNMKDAAKSAGEMRKQLMGFDEANVINDSGNTSSLAFSQNYANQLMQNLKIDEQYFDKLKRKIKDFFDKVKEIAKDPSILGNLLGPWSGWVSGVAKILLVDIPYMFMDLAGIVGGWSKIITGFLSGDWTTMCNGITDVWKYSWQLIKHTFLTAWDVITLPIKSAIWAVQWFYNTWLEPALRKIHEWIDAHLGAPIQWVKDRLYELKKFAEDNSILIKADTSDADNKVVGLLKKYAALSLSLSPAGVTTSGWRLAWNKIRSIVGFDGGGIVLPVPGHGVPIGMNSVMSERRAEGIIPLENPTAMEKLGEAIGRYINIAIDNRMVVDGRVLASATNNQVNKERFLMNR